MRSIRILTTGVLVLTLLAVGQTASATTPEPSSRPSENHCVRDGERVLPGEALVGKSTKRARRIARRHDCDFRVVKRRSRNLAVTDDFSSARLNYAVRAQKVVAFKGAF